MDGRSLYTQYVKPPWAPPSWVIGLVWSFLYVIITVSFSAVFYSTYKKQIPWVVALPFALNLLFNFAFPYIQFGLANNFLASIDILLVVGTLIWALCAVWLKAPELRWVSYANIPYLVWGVYATSVQLAITYLNR
ncbi:MAG: tryptophan-rich sensory protein [Candidatus Saccharibacteria bacterium]|nr:tryptophan-rich sensory protein [Candidatus Saccharibacteria bacterium]